MKPSRELDALVAEKVFKIKDVQVLKGFGPVYDFTGAQNTPRKQVSLYSTDIVAAWEVVEYINSNTTFEEFYVGILPKALKGQHYVSKLGEPDIGISIIAYGDTAPHAICLAALKAMGVEV